MKKALLSLAVASLAVVSASAATQVEIYLTGSTAFRGEVYDALRHLYGGAPASQNPADPGAKGAGKVTMSGTMPTVFGSATVIVRASYSGSATGIQAVTAGANVNFLTLATAGDVGTTNHPADFALSDVFQSSTAFQSPTLIETLDDATSQPGVGIIPFVFVRGNTCSTSVSNITSQVLRGCTGLGYLPLSMFSGNPADTDIVNLVGRDNGSGTRITVLRETGLGALPNIAQRKAQLVSGVAKWIDDPTGWSSGGNVVSNIHNCSVSSEGYAGGAVGYLGLNDANSSVGLGGTILPYNGMNYTPDNVRQGKYTLWAYEHLLAKAATVAPGTDGDAFRTGLKTQLNTDLTTSLVAVQVSSMLVGRSDDGATVTP